MLLARKLQLSKQAVFHSHTGSSSVVVKTAQTGQGSDAFSRGEGQPLPDEFSVGVPTPASSVSSPPRVLKVNPDVVVPAAARAVLPNEHRRHPSIPRIPKRSWSFSRYWDSGAMARIRVGTRANGAFRPCFGQLYSWSDLMGIRSNPWTGLQASSLRRRLGAGDALPPPPAQEAASLRRLRSECSAPPGKSGRLIAGTHRRLRLPKRCCCRPTNNLNPWRAAEEDVMILRSHANMPAAVWQP